MVCWCYGKSRHQHTERKKLHMATKNTLAASVQPKKERLYAVIQYKENGKSKSAWRALGLPVDANKAKINKAFREVVNQFEIELTETEKLRSRPQNEIPVFEYMCVWLEKSAKNIQINTYKSYHSMIYGKIRRYFERRQDITVANIKNKDIEAFYDHLFDDGVVSNTVIHYHAILRKGFQQAFKDELIDANPFDRIDRPKKNKFQGENYSEEELLALLNLTKDDPIFPAIMLAGCLGLRRSEALGMRWSRIDFENGTVLLDTKIVEYKENGKTIIEAVEEMKNKSSRRTLIIPMPVMEMLIELREKQALYRKMFKSSYCREYDDYVCVNQLGELMKPSYITSHFHDLISSLGMRKIRFHDLRHTFASLMLSNNVELIKVSNFLGHSDISTTANIYAHLDKASKKASADVMTNILSGKGVK